MRRIIPIVLALVLVVSVRTSAQEPGVAPLSDEDIAALNELRATYAEAVLANDCEAITAVSAQDVVLMPPNEPMVEGGAAYRDWCEAAASEPPPQDFTMTSLEIDGYGDLAFDRGTWSQTFVSEGAEPVTITGTYVVIVRKQTDDSWLWTVGIYNGDAPLPEPPEEG